MEFLHQVMAILGDLPGHLAMLTASLGPWIYVALFAVIFAETGLIVTPFLPGDSLLFAIGALTAVPAADASSGEMALSFQTLLVLLIAAAVLGDQLNYFVGRWLGKKLFTNPNSKILNPHHLKRTQDFYEKYGGKTLVFARFLPIIRTYAPFVAGLGQMTYRKFGGFSVFGGVIWISIFLSAGHFFGNIPAIKSRFELVVVAIIVISVLPAVVEFIRMRRGRALAFAKDQETRR